VTGSTATVSVVVLADRALSLEHGHYPEGSSLELPSDEAAQLEEQGFVEVETPTPRRVRTRKA
jgi:hypothetical protein